MKLTHGEFINKMAAIKPMADYRADNPKVKPSEAAAKFGYADARSAGSSLRFYHHYQNDPQCHWLAEQDHGLVRLVSKYAILPTEREGAREWLIKEFQFDFTGKMAGVTKKHPLAIGKLFELAGVRYFRKNGRFYAHWKQDDYETKAKTLQLTHSNS